MKIAVIDSQINDQLPVFADASLTIADKVCYDPPASTELTPATLHGSDVTAILVGNGQGTGAVSGIVPGADVIFYGSGEDGALCVQDERSAWAIAMDEAVAAGVDIVTISSASSTPTEADITTLARALAAGVIVIAGTPNDLGDRLQYPAAMNGVVSVNAFDPDGMLLTDDASGAPNVQPEVTVVAPGAKLSWLNWGRPQIMSGSSFATPMVAGILAAATQKYPDATANQLIQSLIHNTGADDHPLERDETGGYGYGPASLRHVLWVDPAQYPDVNPLLDKSFGQPTAEQIVGASAASATPEPTPSATPAAASAQPGHEEASGPAVGWILAAAGGGAVVAVASIVLVVGRARRARRGPV